jgi:Co/Zn/Cd efflux system component
VENSVFIQAQVSAQQTSQNEARILKWLLAINAVMFTVEITVGWLNPRD